MSLDELSQIAFDEFENKVKASLSHDNVLQVDNIGVRQLPQETDFPEDSGGHSLSFEVMQGLLHGDELATLRVSRFVDFAVGALA
jgi:hypothetical protein